MCIFCDIASHKIPSKVVYEDDNVIAILDMSQVTYGHTLVMPKKHVSNILEADDETMQQCAITVNRLAKQIVKNTGALGCNILSNCNEVAGQSVDHMHFHIIPRYGKEDAVDFGFGKSKEQNLDEVLDKVKG